MQHLIFFMLHKSICLLAVNTELWESKGQVRFFILCTYCCWKRRAGKLTCAKKMNKTVMSLKKGIIGKAHAEEERLRKCTPMVNFLWQYILSSCLTNTRNATHSWWSLSSWPPLSAGSVNMDLKIKRRWASCIVNSPFLHVANWRHSKRCSNSK